MNRQPRTAGEEPTPEDLPLSPSERLAHNTAMRVAGAAGSDLKTQRALASIVLGFELVVVFLIGMTVFGLGITEPRELGILGGVALCVVILAALATMRVRKLGIGIGWAVHLLMLASAFVLPAALVVALIFTALWVYCMVRGARIDRERAAWLASPSEPPPLHS